VWAAVSCTFDFTVQFNIAAFRQKTYNEICFAWKINQTIWTNKNRNLHQHRWVSLTNEICNQLVDNKIDKLPLIGTEAQNIGLVIKRQTYAQKPTTWHRAKLTHLTTTRTCRLQGALKNTTYSANYRVALKNVKHNKNDITNIRSCMIHNQFLNPHWTLWSLIVGVIKDWPSFTEIKVITTECCNVELPPIMCLCLHHQHWMARGIMWAGRPSIRRPSVNTYFTWRDSSVISDGIWTKLGINIHHVGGHCWKFWRSRSMSKCMKESKQSKRRNGNSPPCIAHYGWTVNYEIGTE